MRKCITETSVNSSKRNHAKCAPSPASSPHASEPPSKHKRRHDRRKTYYQMIDRELPNERHFSGRIIDTVNHNGMDIGPDGKPIKCFWQHYIKSRRSRQRINSLACIYLLEKTFGALRPNIKL